MVQKYSGLAGMTPSPHVAQTICEAVSMLMAHIACWLPFYKLREGARTLVEH